MRQWGSEAARHGAGRSAAAAGDASSASILRVMAPPCSNSAGKSSACTKHRTNEHYCVPGRDLGAGWHDGARDATGRAPPVSIGF